MAIDPDKEYAEIPGLGMAVSAPRPLRRRERAVLAGKELGTAEYIQEADSLSDDEIISRLRKAPPSVVLPAAVGVAKRSRDFGSQLPESLRPTQDLFREESIVQRAWELARDGGDPGTEAKVKAYSEIYGVPESYLKNNLKWFENREIFTDLDILSQDQEWLKEWAKDPYHLKIGRRDLRDLAKLGAIDYAENGPWYGKVSSALEEGITQNAQRIGYGLAMFAGELAYTLGGPVGTHREHRRRIERLKELNRRVGEEYARSSEAEGVFGYALDVVGVAPQIAAFVGANALAPGSGFALAAGMSGGSVYGELRSKNVSPLYALPITVTTAGIVAHLESLQIGKLAQLGLSARKGVRKELVSEFVSATIDSGTQEFLQGVTEKTGLALGYASKGNLRTFPELKEYFTTSIRESAYEGLVGMALPIPFSIAGFTSKMGKVTRSGAVHSVMEGLLEVSASSKTKQADPGVFAAALSAATGTKTTEYQVDVKDVRFNFQDDQSSFDKFLEAVGFTRESFDEAVARGTASIPVDFVRLLEIVTPDSLESFKNLSNQAYNEQVYSSKGNEAAKKAIIDISERVVARVEELMVNQEPVPEELIRAKKELKDLGMSAEAAHGLMAMIRAAHVAVAARTKQTAAEVSAQFPIQFVFNPDGGALIARQREEAGEEGGTPKGVSIYRDGKTTIQLFNDWSPRTVVHEIGHYFSNLFAEMADSDRAPDKYKNMLDELVEMGFDPRSKDGAEKLAMQFEAYILQGEAPMPKLVEPFREMYQWAEDAYLGVQNQVRANPDVAVVFDALLATDAYLAAAEEQSLFAKEFEAVDAEVSEEEAERLEERRKLDQQRREEYDARQFQKKIKFAHRMAERYIKEMTGPDGLQGNQTLRKLFEEKLLERGDYAALQEISATKPGTKNAAVGVSKKAVLTAYNGAVDAKEFGENLNRIHGQKTRPIYKPNSGLTFQELTDLAAKHGFDSAKSLLDTLRNLPPMQARVEEMLRRRVQEIQKKFVDLEMNEELVEEFYYDDVALNFLLYKAESKMSKIRQSIARKITAGQFRQMVNAVKPKLAQQSASVSVRPGYFIEMAKNRYDELSRSDLPVNEATSIHKRFIHYFVRAVAARELKRQVDSDIREIRRSVPVKVSQTYKKTISILKQFYDSKAQADKSDIEGLEKDSRLPLPEDFVPEMLERAGVFLPGAQKDMTFAPWILNLDRPVDYTPNDLETVIPGSGVFREAEWKKMQYRSLRSLSPDKISKLASAIKLLKREGAFETQSRLKKKYRTLRAYKDVVTEHLQKQKTIKDPKGETFLGRLARLFRSYRGVTDQANFLFQKAGLVDLYDVLSDVSADQVEYGGRLADEFFEIYTDVDSVKRRVWSDSSRLDVIILPEAYLKANPMRENGISFEEAVSIIGHWGHLGGRNALRENGVSEELVQRVASLFSKEDLSVLQRLVEFIGKDFEKISAEAYRLNGMVVEKVVAQPFEVQTADGETVTFTGGYLPLAFDRAVSSKESRKAEEAKHAESLEKYASEMLANQQFAQKFIPTISEGPLQARKGSLRAPELSFRPWTSHLLWKGKFLTSASAVKDSFMVLWDPEIERLITEKLGSSALAGMRDTIFGIAGAKQNEARLLTALNRLYGKATLTFNAGVGVKQVLSLPALFEEMAGNGPNGMKYWLQAMGAMSANPRQTIRQIKKLSKQMRVRRRTFNVYATELMRDLAKVDPNRKARVMRRKLTKLEQNVGFAFISAADSSVVLPGWLAAYNQALNENIGGVTEGQTGSQRQAAAVAYANRVISNSQPSGLEVDKAMIQRNGHWAKPYIIFMTWFLKKANRVFNRIDAIAEAEGVRGKTLASRNLALTLATHAIFPAAIVSLVSHAMFGSKDDDEDLMHSFGFAAMDQIIGGVPIAQEIWSNYRYDSDTITVPGGGVVEPFVRIPTAVAGGNWFSTAYYTMRGIEMTLGLAPSNLVDDVWAVSNSIGEAETRSLREYFKELDK